MLDVIFRCLDVCLICLDKTHVVCYIFILTLIIMIALERQSKYAS